LVLIFLVLPFWYLLTRVVPDKFKKSSKTIVCCINQSRLEQQQQQPFVWDYLGELVPEENIHMLPSGFYGAGEDSRGRHTDSPAGCDPIWTNSHH